MKTCRKWKEKHRPGQMPSHEMGGQILVLGRQPRSESTQSRLANASTLITAISAQKYPTSFLRALSAPALVFDNSKKRSVWSGHARLAIPYQQESLKSCNAPVYGALSLGLPAPAPRLCGLWLGPGSREDPSRRSPRDRGSKVQPLRQKRQNRQDK